VTTRLLIDADLMAYRAASGTQTTHDWGDGVVSVQTNIEAAKRQLRTQIDRWMDELDADTFTICLSDDFRSFRKEDVDASYKSIRSEVERPEVLYPLKDWLFERFPSERRSRLEADDVMGIRSTEPGTGENRIIVSQDKDMKTIPGLLYRPFTVKVLPSGREVAAPEMLDITPEEADRFHLWQTLTGDAVDGYPGAPGMGPVAADKILADNAGFESFQHEFTRGPRKGTVETRWKPKVFDTAWEALVSAFEKVGGTAADALRQARLARILRWEDQRDFRPILWNPT